MRRSLNPVLMMRARDMYARGFSKNAIARALHVNWKTVARWARQDEGRGLGWDKERQARLDPSQEQVIKLLDDRMALMVAEGGASGPEDPEERKLHEERLTRMARIIKSQVFTSKEQSTIVVILNRFIKFCLDKFPADRADVMRQMVGEYLDYLETLYVSSTDHEPSPPPRGGGGARTDGAAERPTADAWPNNPQMSTTSGE